MRRLCLFVMLTLSVMPIVSIVAPFLVNQFCGDDPVT